MLAQKLMGGAGVEPVFVEDIFSTWLYTGNGSTQTITNGIDLAGEGGLVWIKWRSGSQRNMFCDTLSGAGKWLESPGTEGTQTGDRAVSSFNLNGFSLNTSHNQSNISGGAYASWTFRKQPKFFDVVTWTGTGANRTIAHSLGSVPGCIIVKRTDTFADWQVYHRSNANTQYMVLNSTAAVATGATRWNSTTPTSTVFSLGTDASVNANGGSYVAYLFAHDAGGFGLTGTDNVISCGSWTGTPFSVNLGWEPQWVLIKKTNGTSDWIMFDTMRGWNTSGVIGGTQMLLANTNGAEGPTGLTSWQPNATGFSGLASTDDTYIYIAIRRGPMKVPTTGTSVFVPVLRTGTGADALVSTGLATDLLISAQPGKVNYSGNRFIDRLRGAQVQFSSNETNAESANDGVAFDNNNGLPVTSSSGYNVSGQPNIFWNFRRAPGFFDEVCYTGTGTGAASRLTVNHNLQVIPELLIVKNRSNTAGWAVQCVGYDNYVGAGLYLNSADVFPSDSPFFAGPSSSVNTAPTNNVFYVGGSNANFTNQSGQTYVAYLFATCPGVSKVFSYTGNGTTQTINCGFTGGARFILIKRTDSTGNWMVADSARGLVSGNDPTLYLNSTAAEVTGVDWVDPDSSGFIVNQEATMNANVNGGSYIGFAVA